MGEAHRMGASVVPAERSVLPYIIERRARQRPADIAVVFDDLTSWTNAQLFDEMCRLGAGLRDAGVKRNDKVIVWMPNGKRCLAAWLALNSVGAVWVPINTAYRGRLLEHVIDNSDARILLGHPDLVDRLTELDKPTRLAVVYTEPVTALKQKDRFAEIGLELKSWTDLETSAPTSLPVRDLQPWNDQAICYTSGTTGPSKGVLSSYHHLYTMGTECLFGISEDDRFLVTLPLFHAGATLGVYGAMAAGASVALLSTFQTPTFLQQAKATGATFCILLGAMAGFLMRVTPSPADRDHHLRRVQVVPLNEDAVAMSERFGFTVYTVFNMTEVASPLRSIDNPTVRGTCGKLRPGIEARIVDENDCELPAGSAGELILRSANPWCDSHGYYKDPAATTRAWRNGWFHTGDKMRTDADGNFFFIDRLKDAIRRRGENISSFEVEAEILAYPGILEAAVIGIDNDVSEQDVLAAVVPRRGHTIDNAGLLDFLRKRLPYFMVPRYIRQVDELPKTATSKIEKHVLRAQGPTGDTWDREAAGVSMKMDRLSDLQ